MYIRKADSSGRVVIPCKIRKLLGLEERAVFNVTLCEDTIVLADMKDSKIIGSIRKLEELGRIVLPKELRGALCISGNDYVSIALIDEQIHINKYS